MRDHFPGLFGEFDEEVMNLLEIGAFGAHGYGVRRKRAREQRMGWIDEEQALKLERDGDREGS